jgi:hypothetical protein
MENTNELFGRSSRSVEGNAHPRSHTHTHDRNRRIGKNNSPLESKRPNDVEGWTTSLSGYSGITRRPASIDRLALCYARPKTRCFVSRPADKRQRRHNKEVRVTCKTTVGRNEDFKIHRPIPFQPSASFSFSSPRHGCCLPLASVLAAARVKPFSPCEMSLINSPILSEAAK